VRDQIRSTAPETPVLVRPTAQASVGKIDATFELVEGGGVPTGTRVIRTVQLVLVRGGEAILGAAAGFCSSCRRVARLASTCAPGWLRPESPA
jgi:hypothetical protein